jgi:hypothetical protein
LCSDSRRGFAGESCIRFLQREYKHWCGNDEWRNPCHDTLQPRRTAAWSPPLLASKGVGHGDTRPEQILNSVTHVSDVADNKKPR